MTKGIILLEGPDCCGKTTLASGIQHICERFNVPYTYIHADYKEGTNMFEYHTRLLLRAIVAAKQGVVVLDRLHWSEKVYAEVYRGGSPWTVGWRFFERVLNRFAAIRVIATPEDPSRARDWHMESKRDEMYQSGNEKVAEWYLHILNQHSDSPLYFHYDRDKHPLSRRNNLPTEFALRLLQNMETVRNKQSAAFPSAFIPERFNLLGYMPIAKYLLLGEILNPKKTIQSLWPFYDYRDSSLYLTEAMDIAGLSEDDFIWSNFYGPSNDFNLYKIAEANPNIRVISLGGRQYDDLLKYKIFPEENITKIHHPSYAKRFGTSKEDYALQLVKSLYGEQS